MIKDNKLIVDIQEKKEDNTIIYILKNGTKLSDAFTELPYGIVDKTETGIGGTTCELEANRNSIIVFPFNQLADNKSTVTRNGYKILFYGSSYYQQTKKTKVKKISTKFNDPRSTLEDYIKKCDAAQQPIKIACIINQLENLFTNLKEIKKHPAEQFHLVLDEIDTLQEQSSFRTETVKCINLYKKHPKEQRTMISATMIKFHDEELKKESLKVFKYEVQNKPKLTVVRSSNIKEEAVQAIIQLAKKNDEKILVACNNFDYCMDIISALQKSETTKKRTVRILCSSLTKAKAGKYYDTISSDGVLPASINLVTAAYFNGHDINESYHSIILANRNSSTLRLSPKLIYQITGRCRTKQGLLSNQLIISFSSFIKNTYKYYSLKELEGDSKDREALEELLKVLKKSSNAMLVNACDEIENIFTEGTKNFPPTFEIDTEGKIVPSYFKIDSRIEQQETYKLYSLPNNFFSALKEKFTIHFGNAKFKQGDDKLITKKDSVKASLDLLEQLRQLNHDDDIDSSIKNIRAGLASPCKEENTLLNIYKIALNDSTINLEKLHNISMEFIKGKQANARLKELEIYLNFHKFVFPDQLFKDNLETAFPVNDVIPIQLFKNRSTTLIKTFKRFTKTKNKGIKDAVAKLTPTILRNALLETKEKRKNTERAYIILGYQKYKL